MNKEKEAVTKKVRVILLATVFALFFDTVSTIFLPLKIHRILVSYGVNTVVPRNRVLDRSAVSWVVNYSNYTRTHLSTTQADDTIVFIRMSNTVLRRWTPVEVRAVFEVFLLLKERNRLCNIIAVVCEDTIGAWFLPITRETFERLYASLEETDRNRRTVARELARMWTYENFYNRIGLSFNEQNEFLSEITTMWNIRIPSPDERFTLSYMQGSGRRDMRNDILIWEVRYVLIGDTMFRTRDSRGLIPTEETGFAHAAWDEYNNIWVYGETTGLTFLKFCESGDEWWHFTEIGDEEPPYAIQRVMERKQGLRYGQSNY